VSDHRKQQVIGDLLDVRAGDMPSIVPPERRRQLLARINASDRQLVDESSWDSDRHAVDVEGESAVGRRPAFLHPALARVAE
jgi:hypothetical protein